MLIIAAALVNGALALLPFFGTATAVHVNTLPAFDFVTSTIAGGLCALGVFALIWQVRLLRRSKGLVWVGR